MQVLTKTFQAVCLSLMLCVAESGCGLLSLPLALVGAIFSIVQIPLSMAMSLVGPATNAAATAAPYALLFAKLDERQTDWDFVIFENQSKKSSGDFFHQVAGFARTHSAAKSYPPSTGDLKKLIQARDMRCYLVRV